MSIRPVRQLMIGFAVLFLIFIAAGCSSAAQPTSLQATVTESTSTPIIELTLTITPTPTLTPKPSRTPTLSATLGPSQKPDLTEEARATTNAAFPEACGYSYPSVSPDGNWLADDCDEFHVVSRDGQKKIVIPHEEFVLPDVPPVEKVFALYWSRDSRLLYFAARFCCIDTGSFGSYGPLYRLDLQSGAWTKMIGGGMSNDYEFSPTGRRLLHIPASGQPISFHLIDLKTGDEQWLQLESFRQAYVNRWSMDGTRFIITAQIGDIFEGTNQYALFLVSLNDGSFTQLIPLSTHNVYATDWSDDDVLTIKDCFDDGNAYACKSYPYDLKSLPTPKP